MQVAKQVLVDDAGKYPDVDALTNAFIYLQAGLSGFPQYAGPLASFALILGGDAASQSLIFCLQLELGN